MRELSLGEMNMSNVCSSKRILNKPEQDSEAHPGMIRASRTPSTELWAHFSVRADVKSVKKSSPFISSTFTNLILNIDVFSI